MVRGGWEDALIAGGRLGLVWFVCCGFVGFVWTLSLAAVSAASSPTTGAVCTAAARSNTKKVTQHFQRAHYVNQQILRSLIFPRL